ncbi:phage tail protein I [Vibrio campbellii]|uniref:phage tail protein I n=1 Tax=Vibrio campbellii TaxID=680 RepID=UPI00210D0959|nr:phage tail protein I [Vibrio campbellii]UTZ44641.1 phage tail protein I [Vibrio campbellii]UTZ44702.1 phage tail protein I [Vibrio campbellii]
MTDKPSLLPANVSDLERDLEIALARIEDVQIPIATLWDPWKCPLEVLPFLAWALSVDMWRSDWPETVKRRIVANSKSVHRIKGTRPAVEMAMSDIYSDCTIKEWFEMTPPGRRGTFSIEALVSDRGIDRPTINELMEAVENAKRKSAHYTLKVILSSTGEHKIAAWGMSANNVTVEPYSVTELNSKGGFCLAFGFHAISYTVVEAYK